MNNFEPLETLLGWVLADGNLRRFIADTALPPLGDRAQQEAGEAAAATAVEELYGMDLASFHSGVRSVSGSIAAAGVLHVSRTDPDIPQDHGAAAFFDIDNTLIHGSSLLSLALGAARRRYFTLSELATIAWKQLKYRLSGSENHDDIESGRALALNFIKGRSVADLVQLSEEIVEQKMQYRAFPGTRELAEMHLAAGQQVWLVSATPVQLAQMLARHFGLTGALGTVAEEEDGLFTGRLAGDLLHGAGKTHAVAALATLLGLDLSRCTAYSDSANDIPLLQMVGTAVAINPDPQLRKEALRRGWPVREYRTLRTAARRLTPTAALLAGAVTLAAARLGRRA